MSAKTNWNGWKITDELAERINNGDIDACNDFYFDNLLRLRKMACNYVTHNPRFSGMLEDMVQQVYVDMSVWNYACGYPIVGGGVLSRRVYMSFLYCARGGFAYVVRDNLKLKDIKSYSPVSVCSLDSSLSVGSGRRQDEGNKQTLADIVPAPVNTDILNDFAPDLSEKICAIVRDYLSPQEFKFYSYLLEGYAPSVACERLGVKQWGAISKRGRAKLIKNYSAIVDSLLILGFDVPDFAFAVPDGFDDAVAFLSPRTPEQKARANENARKLRARRKAVA